MNALQPWIEEGLIIGCCGWPRCQCHAGNSGYNRQMTSFSTNIRSFRGHCAAARQTNLARQLFKSLKRARRIHSIT